MRRSVQRLLLLACTAVACQSASSREDEKTAERKQTAAEPQAAGSERLTLVSLSGWRPIPGGPDGGGGDHRLPRTPSYAAPLSAADLARPSKDRAVGKDLRTAKRDLSGDHKEQDRQRVDVVLPVGTRTARDPPLPQPPPPPRSAPWDRPRVAPISEPDSDVESVFGYRYPPPVLGGAGPSPTAPFWEAAWLRRRERLLQELGLPSLLPPPPMPCRCDPVDACPGLGPGGYFADGPPGRYRPESDPYRLGVGPYGLYGAWGRPLHSHNSLPLGAAQLHDNPN